MFNSRWKVNSELAEVMLGDRRFQTRGAANVKGSVKSLTGGSRSSSTRLSYHTVTVIMLF